MCLRSKIIVLGCILFASCRKEEMPVKPFDRGDVVTGSVDMNVDYRTQIYYSVSQNSIVSTNLKTAWDLGFESSADGFHVIINTSRIMRVYNTGQTNFSAVTDTIGYSLNKKVDSPTGNLDSTGFGDWRIVKPVYIIDLGYNEFSTQKLGFKKMQVLSVDAMTYNIKVSEVNGNNETTLTIPKNANKNFVDFLFSTNSVVNIEPDKTKYDLLFTQYTGILHDGTEQVPYQVTGVLFNPYLLRGSRVFDKAFEDITIGDTLAYPLIQQRNSIGHDWKDYDLNAAVYTVDTKKCFLFRNVDGFYYKLHFIDFYNLQGLKGAPKFEFKKL